MSVGYSLGIMVFGGATPLINTWLVATTGNRSMPGAYLGICSLVTLIALIAIQRSVPLSEDG